MVFGCVVCLGRLVGGGLRPLLFTPLVLFFLCILCIFLVFISSGLKQFPYLSYVGDATIISQGFLMVEDLNCYFSSVFTRDDISSLPVPDAKFQEAKSEYFGQLIVTPEMVAKKIKAMKDNKSPGAD